jgi:hypothetical protein
MQSRTPGSKPSPTHSPLCAACGRRRSKLFIRNECPAVNDVPRLPTPLLDRCMLRHSLWLAGLAPRMLLDGVDAAIGVVAAASSIS